MCVTSAKEAGPIWLEPEQRAAKMSKTRWREGGGEEKLWRILCPDCKYTDLCVMLRKNRYFNKHRTATCTHLN